MPWRQVFLRHTHPTAILLLMRSINISTTSKGLSRPGWRFSLVYVTKKEHRLKVEQGIFKVRGVKAIVCLEFIQDQRSTLRAKQVLLQDPWATVGNILSKIKKKVD